MRLFVSSVFVVAALVGCSSSSSSDGGPSGQPPAACPVPADARMLVMTTAIGALHEVGYVAEHASAIERPYALGLAGSSQAMLGIASMTEACTAAKTFDPYCKSDESNAHEPGPAAGSKNGCFRAGCEAAGVALVDVYFLDGPKAAPDVRTPLSYATSAPMPSGTMECATNPLRTYRIDVRDPSHAVVDTTLSGSCTFVSAAGARVDLSHEGTAHATHGASDASTSITLRFTKLGAPVEVKIAQAGEAAATGTVESNGRVLARFHEGAPPFTWEGACAE